MDLNTTLLLAVTFVFVIGFVFSMFGQGGGSVYSPLLILLAYPVVTGVAVLIGGNLGARVSMKVKTKMIRAGLGLLMWALAAQLLVKLLGYM